MSKKKEFQTVVGSLTITLSNDKPEIKYTAEISPALHPRGTSGVKLTRIRKCPKRYIAELEFIDFKPEHARPTIEFMMACAEQMERDVAAVYPEEVA